MSWTEYGVKWMCVQGRILMEFIIVGFYYLFVYWKFICLFLYFLFFSILHFVLDSMVKNRKVFTQRLIWEIALGNGWLGDLGRVRNGEAWATWQGRGWHPFVPWLWARDICIFIKMRNCSSCSWLKRCLLPASVMSRMHYVPARGSEVTVHRWASLSPSRKIPVYWKINCHKRQGETNYNWQKSLQIIKRKWNFPFLIC